jgi:Fur family zinc uptake transcriptional regulator
MIESLFNQTMEAVKELCEVNGVRLTKQRKQVLEVLLDANQALSAYELTKIYNERFNSKIIAMSVYRILECLIELRIAYRLDTINKFIVCQHINQHLEDCFPIFVICVQCNDVNEHIVPYSIMQNMRTLANTSSFRVIDTKFELKGVCKNCEHTSKHKNEGVCDEQTFEC